MVLCPTCGRPLDHFPSVYCDRCDTWFHFDCEQIDLETRILLDSSAMGYTCLGCAHEVNCENINESLDIEGRNTCEADPEVPEILNEETRRKEGYEPGIVQTSSNLSHLAIGQSSLIKWAFISRHS